MLHVALEAARAGARVLLAAGLPRPGGQRRAKGAGDWVTDTDEASEHAILEVLARLSPGVAVLAEEAGGDRAGTMWAVDPLDGTTNFTRGLPVVGVSVALIDGGMPVAGVVLAPYLGLEFAGRPGAGATLNGDRLAMLAPGDPAGAVVATGFPFRRKHRLPDYLRVFDGALAGCEDLRRAGAAALDLSWTASGTFDGFFELGLGTWDVAAGAALVLACGGVVTDWEGGDGWLLSGDVLAAPAAVHEFLLKLAAQAPDR